MQSLKEYPFETRPMIIAHRGDTTFGARENSLEAIQGAIDSGADMVEVDVQWTSDEVFVCYHDESIKVGEKKRKISELTVEDLESLEITSLEAVCEVAKSKLYLNLEVKEYSARDPKKFMDALLHLIREKELEDVVLISSFRPDYIREAGWTVPTVIIQPDQEMVEYFKRRSFNPDIYSADLLDLPPSQLIHRCRATSYACMISELTEARVQNLRKNNILLSVYTVTNQAEYKTAVDLGARALVCENPALCAALRDVQS